VSHAQAFPGVRAGDVYEGVWASTMTDKTEIATGDEGRLILGATPQDRTRDSTSAFLHFYRPNTPAMGTIRAPWDRKSAAPSLSLQIQIASVPTMLGGPQIWSLTLGPLDLEQPILSP
jgi:hypothetical protein